MDDTPERFSTQARAELMRALAPGGELAERVDLETMRLYTALLKSRPESPMRLNEAEKIELCRAARRAWDEVTDDDARFAFFSWRGEGFVASYFLGGIRIRDAQWRRVAETRW